MIVRGRMESNYLFIAARRKPTATFDSIEFRISFCFYKVFSSAIFSSFVYCTLLR